MQYIFIYILKTYRSNSRPPNITKELHETRVLPPLHPWSSSNGNIEVLELLQYLIDRDVHHKSSI